MIIDAYFYADEKVEKIDLAYADPAKRISPDVVYRRTWGKRDVEKVEIIREHVVRGRRIRRKLDCPFDGTPRSILSEFRRDEAPQNVFSIDLSQKDYIDMLASNPLLTQLIYGSNASDALTAHANGEVILVLDIRR